MTSHRCPCNQLCRREICDEQYCMGGTLPYSLCLSARYTDFLDHGFHIQLAMLYHSYAACNVCDIRAILWDLYRFYYRWRRAYMRGDCPVSFSRREAESCAEEPGTEEKPHCTWRGSRYAYAYVECCARLLSGHCELWQFSFPSHAKLLLNWLDSGRHTIWFTCWVVR